MVILEKKQIPFTNQSSRLRCFLFVSITNLPIQPEDKDSRPSTPVTIPSLPGNLTFLLATKWEQMSQSQNNHHHHHHHHHNNNNNNK